jgi:hypothetical protein
VTSRDKAGELGAFLIGSALVGAVVGYVVYGWRESYLENNHAGWTIEERAPWCAVDHMNKTLKCRYFSEKHCDIGAIVDAVRGPVGPLCVPRPK